MGTDHFSVSVPAGQVLCLHPSKIFPPSLALSHLCPSPKGWFTSGVTKADKRSKGHSKQAVENHPETPTRVLLTSPHSYSLELAKASGKY